MLYEWIQVSKWLSIQNLSLMKLNLLWQKFMKLIYTCHSYCKKKREMQKSQNLTENHIAWEIKENLLSWTSPHTRGLYAFMSSTTGLRTSQCVFFISKLYYARLRKIKREGKREMKREGKRENNKKKVVHIPTRKR